MNPRRGEHNALSGGAPDGTPALGGQPPIAEDDFQTLENAITDTRDTLNRWDEKSGIDELFPDESPPTGNVFACDAFEEHVSRYGYDPGITTELTAEQAQNISEAVEAVNCWRSFVQANRMGYAEALKASCVPLWLKPALRRQHRHLTPGVGTEQMPQVNAR